MTWPAIVSETGSGGLKGVLQSGASVRTIAAILSAGQTRCGTPIRSPGAVIGMGIRSGGFAMP